MNVSVKLNLAFQYLIGNEENIEVNGLTVMQCLEDFIKKYPGTKNWLFSDQGSLQSMVLLNNEPVSQEELNRPVTDKDELWILNILEGG